MKAIKLKQIYLNSSWCNDIGMVMHNDNINAITYADSWLISTTLFSAILIVDAGPCSSTLASSPLDKGKPTKWYLWLSLEITE